MRKPILTLLIPLLLVFGLAGLGGCQKKLKPEELSPNIATGDVYYTQFSLREEKNRFRTTNYRVGGLIPINTAVNLVSIDKKNIVVQIAKTGQTLTIENASRHTSEDVQQAFQKILRKTPVNLEQFSPQEREKILTGQASKGMSRKAVLAAIGYPPQIATPSLDGNEWTYWANRFNRFIVHFKGDRVQEIVD
jgi:hypothetical protein